MNINHTFQYLQMGLPERINRKKLFGDFEGALQDMESYLLTPDLPDAMRHCLTTEAEMLRRLPSDFPYTLSDQFPPQAEDPEKVFEYLHSRSSTYG